MGCMQLFSCFSVWKTKLCLPRAQKDLSGSAVFTASGKKQADTVLGKVVQVEMKSQKVEEGAKSVFYLPVMSSFIAGFPVYRGASQGIFGKNAPGIRNWYLLREGVVGTNPSQVNGWGPPGMHYLLPMDECGGKKILQQLPLKSFFEAAAGRDFCSKLCKLGDLETGTRADTERAGSSKSLSFPKPLLTVVQANGIDILHSAYVANLAFCL